MLKLSTLLGTIQDSATNAVAARARALKSAGRDVIELARGEPYFDTPENVKQAAVDALTRGDTRYTAVDGTAALKAAIAAKLERDHGVAPTPDEISVGSGCRQVINNALAATLDPGDDVIIPCPYWDCYSSMVRLTGARPVFVSGTPRTGFKVSPGDVEAAITPRTRWLFLNSPTNPTGAVYSRDDLGEIAAVLMRHPHIWLLSDEIYETFVYEGAVVTPVAVEPLLRERTLAVSGVSKTYAMTGFRIGYGAGPIELVRAMARIQANTTANPCSISQAAALEALTGPQDVVAARVAELRNSRDLAVFAINGISGLSCVSPAGACFVFVSCAGALGKRTPGGTIVADDVQFAASLLDAEAVAVTPGSAFGLPSYFRLTYAVPPATLRDACGRLARFVGSLSPVT